MNKKSGFGVILVVLFVVIILAGIGGAIYYYKVSLPNKNNKTQSASSSIVVIDSKTIEKIDFQKILATENETTTPSKGSGVCELGSTEIINIAYGDVTGDGIEEAVVNYRTCDSGTGGGFSRVYSLDNNGNLENITPGQQSNPPRDFPSPTFPNISTSSYQTILDGYSGHGYYGILNSQLIFSFPIYEAQDPNCCATGGEATLHFTWNGSYFVYQNEKRVSSTQE